MNGADLGEVGSGDGRTRKGRSGSGSSIGVVARPRMVTLFALVSWQVWKECNARCFRGSTTTVAELLQIIKDEGNRWVDAGASGLGDLTRR
jgi:hypothetical protein